MVTINEKTAQYSEINRNFSQQKTIGPNSFGIVDKYRDMRRNRKQKLPSGKNVFRSKLLLLN